MLGAYQAGSRGSSESRDWRLSGAPHRRNVENTVLPLQGLLKDQAGLWGAVGGWS